MVFVFSEHYILRTSYSPEKEVVCFVECASPSIGIEKGKILGSQMTASSGDASLARLKGRFAWCPSSDALNEYIQVNKKRQSIFDLICNKK